jgi:membrane protein YdbS with pleckstrin-like domain
MSAWAAILAMCLVGLCSVFAYAAGVFRYDPVCGGVWWRYASNIVDTLAIIVLLAAFLFARARP